MKFLAKYRHHPNTPLNVVKIRIARFKSMDQYRTVWVKDQIADFLAYKFPNEDF